MAPVVLFSIVKSGMGASVCKTRRMINHINGGFNGLRDNETTS